MTLSTVRQYFFIESVNLSFRVQIPPHMIEQVQYKSKQKSCHKQLFKRALHVLVWVYGSDRFYPMNQVNSQAMLFCELFD